MEIPSLSYMFFFCLGFLLGNLFWGSGSKFLALHISPSMALPFLDSSCQSPLLLHNIGPFFLTVLCLLITLDHVKTFILSFNTTMSLFISKQVKHAFDLLGLNFYIVRECQPDLCKFQCSTNFPFNCTCC